MADFLMRDDAPFNKEEWAKLDEVVVHVARKLLVGRRIVELTGPLGAGTQTVPLLTVDDRDGTTQVTERTFLTLERIQHDFTLSWLDIETAQKQGLPLELGPAAAASAACARAEDAMVLQGLLDARGRHTVPLADWDEPDQALQNVVAASEALVASGVFGPFAVVVSPALYAKTQRVARGMGRLVSKLIEDVAEGGLFRSPLLTADQGLVVAQGAHNMDLVVGQDLITAYLGPEGMDHRFRVLESLALRIKRPKAICTLAK